MTNREWLESQDDNNLADFIAGICYNSESGNCRCCEMKNFCDTNQPHYGIREWLKAERQEELIICSRDTADFVNALNYEVESLKGKDKSKK